MENIIIIGSGGHAKVVIDIIEAENKYKIEAVVCDFAEKGTEILGYKIIGGLDMLNELPHFGIIAVGDNYFREQYAQKIKNIFPDFEFITVIHPSAVVSRHARIVAGTIFQANAVIKSDTIIGEHNIINSNVSIGHDIMTSDFVTVGPGALIGGYTTIGRGSAVNMGCCIRDRVKIGEYSIIGMGAVVTKDVPPYVVAYGNPAEVVRERQKDERFYR